MEFNINVKITAPQICEALKELAMAYAGSSRLPAEEAARNLAEATMGALESVTAPATPTNAPVTDAVNGGASAPTNAPAPAPVEAPAPVTGATSNPAPTSPAEPAPAAPSVTLDQIKNAGASLVAQGKLNELVPLMKKYGVQSIPELQPSQFDGIAADLRAMGATI